MLDNAQDLVFLFRDVLRSLNVTIRYLAIRAKGLGIITDLEVGSDGYLYTLSSYNRDGIIFRIVPVYNISDKINELVR